MVSPGCANRLKYKFLRCAPAVRPDTEGQRRPRAEERSPRHNGPHYPKHFIERKH